MATLRIKSSELGGVLKTRIANLVNNQELSTVLVDRAKMRIRNQGDSTHKYEDLWGTRNNAGYRKGGKALRDTGFLMSKLHSQSVRTAGSIVRWILKDGTGYGLKHQEGYKVRGPIAVPLNRKCARVLAWLGDPPHDISAIPDFLEEAPSLKEAKKGSSASIKWDYYVIDYEGEMEVKPRKIANNPPEDIKAISRVIKRRIRTQGLN
jgi:hypothetical protein